MNAVEIYRREILKIFRQFTEMTDAADSDKNLSEVERRVIKMVLQQIRSKLAVGFIHLTKLCKDDEICDEEICDTLQ